jgi:hypothetical protein
MVGGVFFKPEPRMQPARNKNAAKINETKHTKFIAVSLKPEDKTAAHGTARGERPMTTHMTKLNQRNFDIWLQVPD